MYISQVHVVLKLTLSFVHLHALLQNGLHVQYLVDATWHIHYASILFLNTSRFFIHVFVQIRSCTHSFYVFSRARDLSSMNTCILHFCKLYRALCSLYWDAIQVCLKIYVSWEKPCLTSRTSDFNRQANALAGLVYIFIERVLWFHTHLSILYKHVCVAFRTH